MTGIDDPGLVPEPSPPPDEGTPPTPPPDEGTLPTPPPDEGTLPTPDPVPTVREAMGEAAIAAGPPPQESFEVKNLVKP